MADKTIRIKREEIGSPPTDELPEIVYAPDIAEFLSNSPTEVREEVVNTLEDKDAADVFEELPIEVYKKVLLGLNHTKIARVINEMEPDEAVDLLELLPEQDHGKILAAVDDEHRTNIERLKKYHPESAGGLMTTEFLSFGPETCVRDVLPQIRRDTDAETIHVVYVTDEKGRLKGVVSIREILIQTPDQPLKAFMTEHPITCRPSTDQEKVAQLVDKYNLSSLPVVDGMGKLLGIVTVDDVIDVIQEEASEDFSMLAGTHHRHPLSQSVFKRVQARMPWMLTTLALGLMTAVYISTFDDAMAYFAGMTAIFMPVLAGMGGNVGIQSATIIVRAIATGEIRHRTMLQVVLQEVATGSVLGCLCALLSGSFTALLVPWFTDGAVPGSFGLVVGGSMLLGMTVSSACGASIPFIFRGLGKDPALASGPFVTTINDVIGLSVYFFLTRLLYDIVVGGF